MRDLQSGLGKKKEEMKVSVSRESLVALTLERQSTKSLISREK